MSIGSIRLFGESPEEVELEFIGTDHETEVWRSDVLVEGSDEEAAGVPIGPEGSAFSVCGADIEQLPQLPIPAKLGEGTRRKFLAELHSLHLRRDGVELMAGEPYLRHLIRDLELGEDEASRIFRRSYGGVISQSLTGDPEQDFPADNFFNVYFAVRLQRDDGGPITLFNRDPLLVVDLAIPTVPPMGRVTIPQFPFDQMDLFDASQVEGLVAGQIMPAGRGGCCAHSVSVPSLPEIEWAEDEPVEDRLSFARIDFDQLLRDGAATEEPVRGLAVPASSSKVGSFSRNTDNRFVDGTFYPNGITQISSTGIVVEFEETGGADADPLIASASSAAKTEMEVGTIDLDPPTSFEFLAPPQRFGMHLGPNAGLTLNLDRIREAFPNFYLVALVGLQGLSRESPAGSSVRVRVLVDGVAPPFADNLFDTPGASLPIHVDLQGRPRFLSMMCTSPGDPDAAGNGAIALWELRGFGSA